MSTVEAVSVIGLVLVMLGLIGTWIKNGRSQSRWFGGINKQLEDPNHGLSALAKKMENMQTHCASTTSSFGQQIKNHDKAIEEIKTTFSKKKR